MAERPITHILPVDDGYDHDLENCACGPTVQEVDGNAPIGREGRRGALTFTHRAMASSGKYRIVDEVDCACRAPGDTEPEDHDTDCPEHPGTEEEND